MNKLLKLMFGLFLGKNGALTYIFYQSKRGKGVYFYILLWNRHVLA